MLIVDGIGMMLKALGVDAEKIISDFEALKDGTLNTLKEINERLGRIEAGQKQLEEMWKQSQQQTQRPQLAAQVPQQPQQ